MRRLGKFEWKIILALLLTAAAPLSFTWLVVDRLVEESMSMGLNDQVIGSLRSGVDLYKEVIESRIRIARLQGRHLAFEPAFVKAVEERDGALLLALLEDLVAGTSWVSQARVVKGEQVLASAKSPAEFPADRWKSKHDGWDLGDGSRLELTFVIGTEFLDSSGELRDLVVTLENLEENFQPWKMGYYKLFLFIYSWILLAAVILGYLLARSVTKRVAKLVEATNLAAQGNLDVRVGVSSHDEIGSLGQSFNSMLDDLQRNRDRIVYLEKISSWQEIARRMAHEIKNPLTPILLAVQELHRSYRGDDGGFRSKLNDSLEIVEEEVGTLGRMVDSFSEFARLPTVQAESADLMVFVSEFLKLNPQYAGKVVFEPDDRQVPVMLDRVLMGRVLSNLIDNGLEANPVDEQVKLVVEPSGEWAILEVTDRGEGLNDETRERLFLPYFTSKEEGTGLGLAIVKKIVLQHGGEIFVADGVESGTVFTVRLRRDDRRNKVKARGGS